MQPLNEDGSAGVYTDESLAALGRSLTLTHCPQYEARGSVDSSTLGKGWRKNSEGSMVGVGLAILLLASSCSSNLHQRSHACLASQNTQSAECAVYWSKAQPQRAAELGAKDRPPPAPALNLQLPTPQGKKQ
jgi:hypothetical protein